MQIETDSKASEVQVQFETNVAVEKKPFYAYVVLKITLGVFSLENLD